MRLRLPLLLMFVLFTTSVFAKEIWIAVSGTANNVFFSDARIFNPNDKEITIQAYYLPRGNGNNSGEQPTSFTVPKRQMKISDDIVLNLLHRSDVGAIRFVCPDDFVVTQRVYAASDCDPSPSVNLPCTLGQFVQGLEVGTALTKGVLLQLKKNDKFRTNVGAANPNNATANVTWRLYDKNQTLIATSATPVAMPPYAAIGPTAIDSSFFYNVPAGADLSDSWVSFTSDLPIFAYGSVVDNVSTDQTYIPASNDSGTTPAQPQQKLVTIVAQDFAFNVTAPAGLKQNDSVKFQVSQVPGSSPHGFQLFDPDGNSVFTMSSLSTFLQERIITLPKKGTYTFVCSNSSCGEGHTSMFGTFDVETGSNPDPPDGY